MWGPLLSTRLLDSYSVWSQTTSIVFVMIVYKDRLIGPSKGKLSLLSQSHLVPFYSKRALQTYLLRREPLFLHTNGLNTSICAYRAGSKHSIRGIPSTKGLSTDAVRSGGDIRLNFLTHDG